MEFGFGYYANQIKAKKIQQQFHVKNILQGDNPTNIDKFIKTTNPDLILNAVGGSLGIIFSYLTIVNKKTLILANKETLVCCGKQITSLAKKNKIKIYPVDSEHSAIYSLIKQKHKNKKIKEIIITASGGNFYNFSYKQLEDESFCIEP